MWLNYLLIMISYYSFRHLFKLEFTLGEIYCKRALKNIFKNKYQFKTIRPDWLKNPETGKNLEIDLYCKELNLGIEYNGIQHYIYPNCFHKTKEQFIAQVRRDEFKKRMCNKHKLHLIVVPYKIRKDYIELYIRKKLKKIFGLPDKFQFSKREIIIID
jgi:hypothetical protein